MPERDEVETIEVPAGEGQAQRAEPVDGLDLPLLLLLLAILAAVAASNVWLRRRAGREQPGE